MKKIVALFVFALFVSSPALLALDKEDGDRVGGIRLGYHSSQFNLNGSFYGEPMQTFYAGFFRDQKIVPLLHFGSGLEYYKNGVKIDSDNMRELHYLTIPLNLKLKLGPVFALGGFSPSFKVAERITEDGFKEKPTDDEKAEWFDIPLYLGAGVNIWFLTIEARYHWGMLEVVDGYKTQSFQIGAGISF